MSRRLVLGGVVFGTVLGLLLWVGASARYSNPTAAASELSQLDVAWAPKPRCGDPFPAAFVANHGQWNSPAQFVLARRGLVLEVHPTGLVCRGRAAAMRPLALTFEGASKGTIDGVDPVPGVRHFFVGNDPARWRTNVRAFAQVLWRGLYPGVDVRLVTTADGVRYDLLLSPGADLSRVSVRCDGHTDLRLAPDGAVTLDTALGAVRQSPPVAWYEQPDGQRVDALCRFVRIDQERFGFELVGERLNLPLVVDPGVDF